MSDVNAPAVQLEGWLPGEENNGLTLQGGQLMDAWHEAKRTGENTTMATLTLIVGFVECVSVKERKDPKEPVVATRFVRLEVIKPGADYQTVSGVLKAIHDGRIGDTPLPGMGGDDEDGDDEP